MKISAKVESRNGQHSVTVATEGREHSLALGPKPDGAGSEINGGELLFLALATCYCNDLYREARKRGIEIRGIGVEVEGEFGAEGEPALRIAYRVAADSSAPREEVVELMRHTDEVAEIHNTLRRATSVTLSGCELNRI